MRKAVKALTFGGNSACMYSRGDLSRWSDSAECWWNHASRRWLCFFTMPSVGISAPAIILSSVDLPAPLGPTSATRDSRSTPTSTSL